MFIVKKWKNDFPKLVITLLVFILFPDQVKAIYEAEAIVVGGGNTWQLVRMMHNNK
jgi:peptidase E